MNIEVCKHVPLDYQNKSMNLNLFSYSYENKGMDVCVVDEYTQPAPGVHVPLHSRNTSYGT